MCRKLDDHGIVEKCKVYQITKYYYSDRQVYVKIKRRKKSQSEVMKINATTEAGSS